MTCWFESGEVRPMKQYLLIAILFLTLPNLALFAESGAGSENLYRIELIAFGQNAVTSESWPEDPGVPDPIRASSTLIDAVGDSSNELVSKDQLALGPVAYTLRKNGMSPLLHIGWMQQVKRWKADDWRWIETRDLRGLVRVTKGRFLHIDVDLLYVDPVDGQPYRIVASRKMRSNELHHLDHPRVGLLVTATRPEEEQATTP